MKRSIVFLTVALVVGAAMTFLMFDSRPEGSIDSDPEARDTADHEPARSAHEPVGPGRLESGDDDRVAAEQPVPDSPPRKADESAPAPRAGRISGRVLDSDTDQPLVGAIVTVRRSDGVELEATTDVAGVFRIDDVQEGETCDLIASAREHRTRSLKVKASRTRDADELLLRLDVARTLRGRVVDEHGSGVPARLEIRRGARRWMVDCDESGVFVVEEVLHRLGLSNRPPARVGQIWVRSDEHRDAFVQLERDAVFSGSPLEIRVEGGASISGRCVAPGDQPVVGVEITCYPLDESSFAGMRTARTDASGRFRIGGLGPGRHHLEAQPTYGDSAPNPRTIVCDLAARESLETQGFTYAEGYPIRGRVIAKLDEAPLVERIVTLEHDDWLEPLVTVTDHEGAFAFGPLASGEYRVVLRGESWFDPIEPQWIVTPAGAVDLRFVVDEPPRDGALRLELRDAVSGAPLADVPLAIRAFVERDGEREPISREGRTDESGAFVVSRLPRATIRGRVALAGFARSGFEITIDAPEQTIARELSLSRGVTVRGRVFDAAGLAIEGASVADFPRDDLDATFDPDAGSSTSRNGEFELRNVDPNAAWICAFAEGFAPARIAIDPGGRDVYDLRFDLAPGATVSGVVRHESGAPARRFLIECVGSIASQRAATDDLGRFEFLAVEPGAFTLEDGDGFILQSGEVDDEPLEVEIVVPDR